MAGLDRLEAYRAGMAARRAGEALDPCPLEGENASAWTEGWWDEEAYSAQREVLVVVQGEVHGYRAALHEVLRFLPACVFEHVYARVVAVVARRSRMLHGDRAA